MREQRDREKTISKNNIGGIFDEVKKILECFNDKNIGEAREIIRMVIENNNRKNMREYINKKNEYLEKYRTLTDEQFDKLFPHTKEYGKTSINQRSLAMCKMYTSFEILKNTDFFDVMIKTHLKETEKGRKVRLPFFSKDGIRIKVGRDEIDKIFTGKIEGKDYRFCINSESEFNGFKILEIAFLKRMQTEPGPNWEEHRHNLQITGNCKLQPESILYHTRDYRSKIFKILFKNLAVISPCNDECKNFAFKYFNKRLYGIDLSINKNVLEDNGNSISIEGDTIKHGKKIKISLPHRQSFMKKGKNMLRFFYEHSYSIEKCYISDIGEKRCWIVNPWHTDIKFDVSFEDCKKIFKFNIIGFDCKNMFV